MNLAVLKGNLLKRRVMARPRQINSSRILEYKEVWDVGKSQLHGILRIVT